MLKFRMSDEHFKDIFLNIVSLPTLKAIIAAIVFVFTWVLPEASILTVSAVYLLILFDTILGIMKAIKFKCFSSEEFFRVGIKSVVYFVLLGAANLMDRILPIKAAADIMSSFLFLTELSSVVENSIILGVPIPNKILDIMKVFQENKENKNKHYPKHKFRRN